MTASVYKLMIDQNHGVQESEDTNILKKEVCSCFLSNEMCKVNSSSPNN